MAFFINLIRATFEWLYDSLIEPIIAPFLSLIRQMFGGILNPSSPGSQIPGTRSSMRYDPLGDSTNPAVSALRTRIVETFFMTMILGIVLLAVATAIGMTLDSAPLVRALALVALYVTFASIFFELVSADLAQFAIDAGVQVERGLDGVGEFLKGFDSQYGDWVMFATLFDLVASGVGTFPIAVLSAGTASWVRLAIAATISVVGFFSGLIATTGAGTVEGCVFCIIAAGINEFALAELGKGLATGVAPLLFGPGTKLAIGVFLVLLAVANFITFLASVGYLLKYCTLT